MFWCKCKKDKEIITPTITKHSRQVDVGSVDVLITFTDKTKFITTVTGVSNSWFSKSENVIIKCHLTALENAYSYLRWYEVEENKKHFNYHNESSSKIVFGKAVSLEILLDSEKSFIKTCTFEEIE